MSARQRPTSSAAGDCSPSLLLCIVVRHLARKSVIITLALVLPPFWDLVSSCAVLSCPELSGFHRVAVRTSSRGKGSTRGCSPILPLTFGSFGHWDGGVLVSALPAWPCGESKDERARCPCSASVPLAPPRASPAWDSEVLTVQPGAEGCSGTGAHPVQAPHREPKSSSSSGCHSEQEGPRGDADRRSLGVV